jgi:hypothetical protein
MVLGQVRLELGRPEGRDVRSQAQSLQGAGHRDRRSGGPLGVANGGHAPDVEFRNHFEGGDPGASVPDLIGVGIMSDGDQTGSVSEADYADFVIVSR